jgi:rRNA maturation protein Nop10
MSMAKSLYYCEECKEYTLKQECCGNKTISRAPPKYSPDDRYASYRKDIKKKEWAS